MQPETHQHPTKSARLARLSLVAAAALATTVLTHAASTCPFDTGGSDALNDGVVLTRYALGITGAPLVASTRYASLDPLQVKANIECVGCALDINGDGMVDTVDTTIIARRLAGFTGASLTAGLALGSGTRPDLAAVTSFLANGCAVGGAINAFVQGGNSFGVPGVIGTNDAQPLTVKSGGNDIKLVNQNGDGLRVSYKQLGANTVNGYVFNFATAGVYGATVGGGGGPGINNAVQGNFGTSAGGSGNLAGNYAVVSGGAGTAARGAYGTPLLSSLFSLLTLFRSFTALPTQGTRGPSHSTAATPR